MGVHNLNTDQGQSRSGTPTPEGVPCPHRFEDLAYALLHICLDSSSHDDRFLCFVEYIR